MKALKEIFIAPIFEICPQNFGVIEIEEVSQVSYCMELG